MQIDLTNKEFRYLLDLVYIGNWVLNSIRGDNRFADYDAIESKLFGLCRGTKLQSLVENWQGEEIPSRELPLVFDRFHKLDKSRARNQDGWGLGLYIVKTLVDRHGENISVTSQNGRTEFTFTLPVVN